MKSSSQDRHSKYNYIYRKKKLDCHLGLKKRENFTFISMKVHFKGTRGSIPISYTAAQIKKKVVGALLAARGKDLRSESQILEFVEKKLPFHLLDEFQK